MTYCHEHAGMGVMVRFLLILLLFTQITVAAVLAAFGWAAPDPQGMLWLAIAGFVGLMVFCTVLIDSQNPHGVL